MMLFHICRRSMNLLLQMEMKIIILTCVFVAVSTVQGHALYIRAILLQWEVIDLACEQM